MRAHIIRYSNCCQDSNDFEILELIFQADEKSFSSDHKWRAENNSELSKEAAAVDKCEEDLTFGLSFIPSPHRRMPMSDSAENINQYP
ncbi:hypothetical protein NPIL_604571 [Nephila pilipes]|uniref:Uncharacterized protein n=1 Tax=Nephila pilipes TaxID=299642 RepID=A0A8X6JHM6_NEPPI|nr:hypothetical protein NPIL_604571 [Nephila pilipes]